MLAFLTSLQRLMYVGVGSYLAILRIFIFDLCIVPGNLKTWNKYILKNEVVVQY